MRKDRKVCLLLLRDFVNEAFCFKNLTLLLFLIPFFETRYQRVLTPCNLIILLEKGKFCKRILALTFPQNKVEKIIVLCSFKTKILHISTCVRETLPPIH